MSLQTRGRILFISYFVVQLLIAPLLLTVVTLEQATMLTSVGLLLLALYLYKDHLQNEFERFTNDVKSWGKFTLRAVGYYAALYILRIVVMMILMNFMDIDNLAQNQQSLNELSTGMSFISMFVMVSIYAPIVEELVFREVLIGNVDPNNKRRMIFVTVFSIFLFTILHSYTIADFFLYLPLTLVLTRYYFDYNRNVVASIFFHFINNTIAIIVMFLLL